jgi:hypothetical protein
MNRAVFNRSQSIKNGTFQCGVNQEINKRNFYLKNNTSYRFANDAGIERVLINTNYLESNYLQNNFQLSNSTSFKTLIGKKTYYKVDYWLNMNKIKKNLE